MWHSETDILKDLISLDDFGVSGMDESREVLYSFGRGLKTQQTPKLKNSFVDPRNGESIDLDDEIFMFGDTSCKGKGRGSALSCFSRSEYQLKKQLRLARPLGSSDLAIESYCRRNIPEEREENITNTSDSECNTLKNKVSSDINCTPLNSLVENTRQKVKATRNSKLQHNVLIDSLLSKGPYPSDLSSIVEKLYLEENDDDDDDDDDDGGGGGGGGDGDGDCKGDSSMTASLCSSSDVGCSSNRTTESDVEKYDSDTHMKIDSVSNEEKVEQGKDFALIDNSHEVLKRSEIEYQMKLSPRIIANFSKFEEQTDGLSKMPKRLGERFSKKSQLCEKRNESGTHDFGDRFRDLTSGAADSFDEAEHLQESTLERFTVNYDDFPSLKRNKSS